MNTVELIKTILKNRHIPVSRMEKELGFGNGYIGQLRKGTLPADRLSKVANYLDVTVDYLLNGEETQKNTTPKDGDGAIHLAAQREVMAGRGVRILLDADAKLSQDQLDDILWFIQRQQEKNGR